MTVTETPIDLAREMRDLIEEHAEQTDVGGTMARPVVDAFIERGLFGLLVPEAFGGMEADIATIVGVCEELAFADGATGWAYAQNITVGGCTAYLEPEIGRAFAELPAGAGMFAPLGVAEQIDGGYRVSGSYPFGSGSGHAVYMGGGALVMRDGEVAPMDEPGTMPVVGYLVGKGRFELKGNWDVMGLQGTGSYDFEIPEQDIPAGQAWYIFAPGISPYRTGGPIYGLGSMVLGTISSAAWAVGVAERALHEIRELAIAGRARLGSDPLAEQMTFQRGLGFHSMAVESVRLLCVDSYQKAVDGSAARVPDDEFEQLLRDTKSAAKYVTEVAKAAVTWAWEQSGSAGMRNPSILQRCFRDIYMGAGHQVFDDRNYLQQARSQLGLEVAGF
ncbi:MAG: acyl-CoA dehydrogenase family protein [Actinomycetota bacterium]